MTKLCPRGKAAAKRKFKVYPSAYANAYASKICAGKIKDPSGVKRKDFRGSKAEGGPVEDNKKLGEIKKQQRFDLIKKQKDSKKKRLDELKKELGMRAGGRAMRAGGGLMEATARLKRQGLKGGGICKKGMNRQAVGKNS